MVSFDDTSGQHFQSVRAMASLGNARLGAFFALLVLEPVRGIVSIYIIGSITTG